MQNVVRWSIVALLSVILLVTAITVLDPSVFGRFYLRSGDIHVFPGVRGPADASRLEAAKRTDWREFDVGGTSRLAVLLSDRDSAWLGLAHGLKSIGIPFIVTDDAQRAMRHRVVLVYPLISGRVFGPEVLAKLGEHVRNGGTLIGINVLGGGLHEVFGFDEVRATREHTRVRFDPAHEMTAAFSAPEEREIRIASRSQEHSEIGAHEYRGARNTALASYPNGEAAITWRAYSGGHAYAIGFDPGLLLQKAHGYRLEGVAPAYVNVFEPTLDVILRLIKRMYRQGEPGAVFLRPVPWNKSLAVNITHDVDYSESLAKSVEYARLERELGVTATYFIQTKYIRDWNDEIFFDDRGVDHVRELVNAGMEIASHSVSHSKVFSGFPPGTGDERYPDYAPYVYAERSTYEGTVLGELRVSKFLLDRFSGGPEVTSFRAGHLENPFSLPQALQTSGYYFDSTITANNALSHLPYRLNFDRGGDAQLAVWEFPVTIEDERPPELPQRLDEAIDVANNIARYGGNFVVLIHPNETGAKLEFERSLIESLKPISWFGSISEFGNWWRTRDAVSVDSDLKNGSLRINIHSPRPISGLTLELPEGFEFNGRAPESVAFARAGRIVLETFEGQVELELVADR